uniref:Snurportin-1 n=1 Tax=Ditylenchus dipsaci TaxID=166011 RepID=A0A915DGH4_9BILA
MDEIIAELSGAFSVSENSVHGEHPRFSQYKNEGKVSESQRARRLSHLERQARARDVCLNRFRNLIDNESEAGEKDPIESEEQKLAQVEKKHTPKVTSQFGNILMFSEWLVDIPDVSSLSTEWLMVPCPKGKRTLVVAMNGQTTAYNKAGGKGAKGVSNLPGGNQNTPGTSTMLDCIFVKGSEGIPSKYYVLDLLSWNDFSFTSSDFNCRRFFLKSRLEEMPELSNAARFSFQLLPSCLCTKRSMSELMKTDFSYMLDGLLFYYSEVFYIPGQTPLVGWLKPWMLPEILGVEIPERYKEEQEGFSNSHQFIEKYNEKHHFKSSITPVVESPLAEVDPKWNPWRPGFPSKFPLGSQLAKLFHWIPTESPLGSQSVPTYFSLPRLPPITTTRSNYHQIPNGLPPIPICVMDLIANYESDTESDQDKVKTPRKLKSYTTEFKIKVIKHAKDFSSKRDSSPAGKFKKKLQGGGHLLTYKDLDDHLAA